MTTDNLKCIMKLVNYPYTSKETYSDGGFIYFGLSDDSEGWSVKRNSREDVEHIMAWFCRNKGCGLDDR